MFGFAGAVSMGVTLAIYYLFIWINPDLYQIGNLIGWIVGIFCALVLNKKLVFKDSTEQSSRVLIKSYLVYAASFLLTVLLLHIQIEWLNISPILAPLISAVISTPINFLANKFWTFNS